MRHSAKLSGATRKVLRVGSVSLPKSSQTLGNREQLLKGHFVEASLPNQNWAQPRLSRRLTTHRLLPPPRSSSFRRWDTRNWRPAGVRWILIAFWKAVQHNLAVLPTGPVSILRPVTCRGTFVACFANPLSRTGRACGQSSHFFPRQYMYARRTVLTNCVAVPTYSHRQRRALYQTFRRRERRPRGRKFARGAASQNRYTPRGLRPNCCLWREDMP